MPGPQDQKPSPTDGRPVSESVIDGFIDSFNGSRIVGWACDRARPEQRLLIEIVGDRGLITVRADQERRDVAMATGGDGFCGFAAELYSGIASSDLIFVREASTGLDLPGSPLRPSQVSAPADDARTVEGFIDYIDGNRIIGWAYDRSLPKRRLSIEIAVGTNRAIVAADRFRQDVADSGRHDGHCGFEFNFDIRSAGRNLIYVREASTGTDLEGSPFHADPLSRLTGPSYREALDAVHRAVRLALSGPSRERELAGDRALRGAGTNLDHLLGHAFPDSDPEGLITPYVAFEIERSERRDLAPEGSLTKRMAVLHWYLTQCNIYHGLPVPLSRRQIAFLNAPMPLMGLNAEISVAAHAFIKAEYDRNIELHDPEALAKAVYWWCVKRSPQIAPAGELITQAQIRLLAEVAVTGGSDCPLTLFLRMFHAAAPDLQSVSLQSDAGRLALCAIVLLQALDQPHLAKLMPRSLVNSLLHSVAPGHTAPFEALVALCADPVEAKRIVRRVHALFDETDVGGNRPEGAGLPFLPDRQIADGCDAGVAVIGPVRATSGLGQAARLSLHILERAGRAPVQLDFFPGNPAPIGFANSNAVANLTTPRRINLLHLNAEVIPHAFALLDRRITERSYNIGYFFWELDTIPACHRLAFELLDEIWVSSEYNREIYARATAVPVHNVGMAAEEISDVTRLARSGLGLPEDAFIFVATFDSFSFVARKNPLGVVAAFQTAFPVGSKESVALVLKTQNRARVFDPHQRAVWEQIDDAAARDPRIIVIDRTLSYDALISFKRACDAYVSLHRSEGWGFGLLEAMQLGLPVIATAYSGNMEFCSAETAFLVDFDLKAVLPTEYVYAERDSRWAEPSISSAANAFHEVFVNKELRLRKASAGRTFVRTNFSLEAIARRYGARLDAIEAQFAMRPASGA
ncbi:putative glycosyl transferase [Methylobacterium sp. ME121]|jgi:glycosyltransferase involved in cell wall biosynthesis|nr:putative glycosyl transferase [Methylobacterium sp. ME121]